MVEEVNYQKVIAEQLTRIGDILTAAFQGQIMQYNNHVRMSNLVTQEQQKISELETVNQDLLEQVSRLEKDE